MKHCSNPGSLKDIRWKCFITFSLNKVTMFGEKEATRINKCFVLKKENCNPKNNGRL